MKKTIEVMNPKLAEIIFKLSQAALVGDAPWSPAVDVNIGAAGIYTPVDYGFPDNGILASGEFNKSQWVFADIDLELCEKVRAEGQVFNYRDWALQTGI